MNNQQLKRVLDRAAARYGVLSARDAPPLELEWRAIRAQVPALGGTSMYAGTVQVPGPWDHYLSRCASAVAAVAPGALVTGRSGARCWDLTEARDLPVRLLIGPAAARPVLPKVVAWRTRMLTEQDRSNVEGVPVAGVNRTLMDMARQAEPGELAEAIAKGVQRGLTSIDELRDYLAEHRRHRAANMFERALDRMARDGKTDSGLERRVRQWLREHGFCPAPGTHELLLESGKIVRIDIFFPDERVGLEVDGLYWHGTPRQQHADLWRQREIEQTGWVVSRVCERDLLEESARLARFLWALLQRRREEFGIA